MEKGRKAAIWVFVLVFAFIFGVGCAPEGMFMEEEPEDPGYHYTDGGHDGGDGGHYYDPGPGGGGGGGQVLKNSPSFRISGAYIRGSPPVRGTPGM